MRSPTGSLSSAANWVTFDFSIGCLISPGAASGGRLLFLEPRLARGHDELARALRLHAGDLGELLGVEIGERVHRRDALGSERARGLVVHAFHSEKVLGGVLDRFLALDRLGEKRIARAAPELVHRLLVEGLDL